MTADETVAATQQGVFKHGLVTFKVSLLRFIKCSKQS